MAEYVLENNILKVTVDSKGCEIRDVLCKTDNTHRMWNANPEGWKRVAPVLFPLIGKYKDNQSIYNGKVYEKEYENREQNRTLWHEAEEEKEKIRQSVSCWR